MQRPVLTSPGGPGIPPTEVVRRWVELCRPEGWAHRGYSRLICLDPLNIQERDMTMDIVRIYVDLLGSNLQAIADLSEGWQQRDRVDTIIIPV